MKSHLKQGSSNNLFVFKKVWEMCFSLSLFFILYVHVGKWREVSKNGWIALCEYQTVFLLDKSVSDV